MSGIGRRHLIGHVFARQFRKGLGRSDLHRVVDGARLHVERPAENVGKAQNVVDLVGIVRAARRHDGVVAHGRDVFGRDFRIGIGHGKYDRTVGHRFDHVLRNGALDRKAEEHIGAF